MVGDNQCLQIIEYLLDNNTITSAEAMNQLGVGRLASRINEIRHKEFYQRILEDQGCGLDSRFITVFKKDGSEARVKEYFLYEIEDPQEEEEEHTGYFSYTDRWHGASAVYEIE